MLDTPFAKRLVQFVVHVEKEVVVTAVDHQRQIAVRYAVQLGHHRMVVPRLAIGRLLAELFGHFPVLGERTDIHAAARRSAGAERILVAERKPQPAVAAHAETRNRTARTVAPRRIVGVHVIDQLARDEGLETRRGVFRAVPVPAVLAVGTNDDHAVPVGHLRQRRLHVEPRFLIAAVSVKQVQHRHSDSALRRVGHDHDDRDLLFHRFAPHGNPVDRRSRNR